MPLLQPQIEAASSQLMAEILPRTPSDNKDSSKTSRAKQILDKHGLSLEECAREMRFLLNHSEDDAIKMRVVDTSLKIHGALEPEKQASDIVIQFTFNGEPSLGVLIPR